MSSWTQDDLEAEAARREAHARNVAKVWPPDSDAARIARLEADVFVLQIGLVRATRVIESLSTAVQSMLKGPP